MIRCTKCHHEKSTTEFYYNASRGRYNSWCKQCVSEQRRARRDSGSASATFTQTVGLELEFVGASLRDVADAIQRATGQAHVPVLHYHSDRCDCCGQRFGTAHWRVMRDGSVTRGDIGGEVVSPILVFPRDAAVLKAVLEAMRGVGAGVNTTTGLHVHHGVRGYLTQVDEFRALVGNFVNAQRTMDNLVSASRRQNGYCEPMGSFDVATAQHWTTLRDVRALVSRYRSLNLEPFARLGTVEFRQHQGTLNFSKIMAWVELGQAMIRAAKQGVALTGGGSVEVLTATLTVGAGLATDTAVFLKCRSEVLAGTRDDEDMPVLARAAA